jgi:hypothetical protein
MDRLVSHEQYNPETKTPSEARKVTVSNGTEMKNTLIPDINPDLIISTF